MMAGDRFCVLKWKSSCAKLLSKIPKWESGMYRCATTGWRFNLQSIFVKNRAVYLDGEWRHRRLLITGFNNTCMRKSFVSGDKKKILRDHAVVAWFEVATLLLMSKHHWVQISCLNTDCVTSWTDNEVKLHEHHQQHCTVLEFSS